MIDKKLYNWEKWKHLYKIIEIIRIFSIGNEKKYILQIF